MEVVLTARLWSCAQFDACRPSTAAQAAGQSLREIPERQPAGLRERAAVVGEHENGRPKTEIPTEDFVLRHWGEVRVVRRRLVNAVDRKAAAIVDVQFCRVMEAPV